MVLSFALFENYKLFNDQVVKILSNNHMSSGEYYVRYQTIDGKTHGYTADTEQEFLDDFKDTDLKFPEPKKEDEKFDVVYYIGNKKVETIKFNVLKNIAYSIKNKYKNNPNYKSGKIVVEPNVKKTNEKKVEGMVPGYTDPNPKNLKYNKEVIPKRDRKKAKTPNLSGFAEIGIGSKDPVKKFKDWKKDYWKL